MSLKSRVKKLTVKLGEPVGERCPTCRGPVPWDDSRWVRYFLIAPNGVVVSQESRCDDCGQRVFAGRGNAEPSTSDGNVMGQIYVACRGEVLSWNMTIVAGIRRSGLDYTGPEGSSSEVIWEPTWETVDLEERDVAVIEEHAIPRSVLHDQLADWCNSSPFVATGVHEEPDEGNS